MKILATSLHGNKLLFSNFRCFFQFTEYNFFFNDNIFEKKQQKKLRKNYFQIFRWNSHTKKHKIQLNNFRNVVFKLEFCFQFVYFSEIFFARAIRIRWSCSIRKIFIKYNGAIKINSFQPTDLDDFSNDTDIKCRIT